jgi:hypothetical protein
VLAVWRLGILIGWRVGSSRGAWVGVEVWGKDLIFCCCGVWLRFCKKNWLLGY